MTAARGWRRGWRVVAAAVLAACGLAGCAEQGTPGPYEVITGTVEGRRPETGLLLLRAAAPVGAEAAARQLACVLTSDTEIYVNDRFSSFEAIEIGDTVELVGCPDPSPRGERFLVSLAHIQRNEPPPPELDLSPAALPAGPASRENG